MRRSNYTLITLTAVLPLLVTPAFAVDNLGLFELDYDGPTVADAIDNGFGGDGDDWENVANGTDGAFQTTGIVNDTLGNNDNVLTGGGTKDDNDLDQWQHKTAKATPDKDNITNAYAAAYTSGNDTIIYFGADRLANNGDAQIGFWFFQEEITVNPDGTFSGVHQVGDILILANFLQGGVVGEVDVFEWVPGGGDMGNNNLLFLGQFDACDGSGDIACALTNSTDTPAFWSYTPKFGTDGLFPQNSLFEGGVNLGQLLGNTCFASFMAESRTSQSTDAVLKDFVLADFDLCGIAAAKACEATLNAAGNQVTVDFSGTVENTGAATVNVEISDSETGSMITAVCFEDDGDGCDAGDATPANLTALPAATATFDLDAGDTVRYEGSYTVNAPITSLDFTDTVTAIARELGSGDVVDTQTAEAMCTAPANPNLAVTKDCTPSFDGTTFTASITGSATNTGNVQLINVELSDTVFAAGDLTVVDDTNGNGLIDAGEPAFDGALEPGTGLAFEATFNSTSTTSHSNTMTVSGDNVFDADTTGSDASASDDASCAITINPALGLTKICDSSLGGGTGVELVQQNGVVVVQVGNIITVSNDGDTLLDTVTVSDDQITQLMQTSGPAFDCTAGSSCTGSLDVGESAVFTQTYQPDGNSIIGALTTPGGVSFVNEATASASTTFGDSLGPLTDTAECALCP